MSYRQRRKRNPESTDTISNLCFIFMSLFLHFHTVFSSDGKLKAANKNQQKQERGKCIHFRLDSTFHLRIYHRRDGVDPRTSGKIGDHKIIHRHCGCHQKTGHDARHQFRPADFEKGIQRGGSKIKCSLICIFIESPKTGQDI